MIRRRRGHATVALLVTVVALVSGAAALDLHRVIQAQSSVILTLSTGGRLAAVGASHQGLSNSPLPLRAHFTSGCTMAPSSVSPPTAVALTRSGAVRLRVPANTF